MTKLPKGPLKIIAPIVEAAIANRQRAGAGAKRFKDVWRIFVLNEDGVSFTPYTAFTFRTSGLTPRHEPLGIRNAHPQANSAMRTALASGIWFETRSEITLDFDSEVVATTPAETAVIKAAALAPTNSTEETPVNG